MEKAAALAHEDTVLLTTDADGRVPANWINANLAIIESGVQVVAGRAEIDPSEAKNIPNILHEDDARECHYGRLVGEIDALLDPDPSDPWPRHNEHSGASLAVTLPAYRIAGGIPLVSPGEDRAFVEALKRTDAIIRHASEISVVVSGRIVGRAIGGMADTIHRRLVEPDQFLDEQLESAHDTVKRARLRRLLRLVWNKPDADAIRVLAERVLLNEVTLRRAMLGKHFGMAWAEIERLSPALVRRPVLVRDLNEQVVQAGCILRVLRNKIAPRIRSMNQGDSALFEPGALA